MPSIMQMFQNAQTGNELLQALQMLFEKRTHIKDLVVEVRSDQTISLSLQLDFWAHCAGHKDSKLIFRVKEVNPYSVKELLEKIWKNSFAGIPPTASDAQKLFYWTEFNESGMS